MLPMITVIALVSAYEQPSHWPSNVQANEIDLGTDTDTLNKDDCAPEVVQQLKRRLRDGQAGPGRPRLSRVTLTQMSPPGVSSSRSRARSGRARYRHRRSRPSASRPPTATPPCRM